MRAGSCFLSQASNPSAVAVCYVEETCHSALVGKVRPDGEVVCAGKSCGAGGVAASCRGVVEVTSLLWPGGRHHLPHLPPHLRRPCF